MATPDEDDLMIGAGLDSLFSQVANSSEDVNLAGVPGSDDDALVLELADLLPDDAGEVVLMAGEDVAVNLQSDEPMTGSGGVKIRNPQVRCGRLIEVSHQLGP